MAIKMTNLLSIDVEDYFHVSAFEAISPPAFWETCEFRVDRNTEKVLRILEEAGAKATFFVLGWVARRFPELVRRIAAEGHEVASHGFHHRRVGTQSRAEFREDIHSSKALLEDLSGQAVLGYRAPSYSISMDTLWSFEELWATGYRYDSSVFPMRHDFYGISGWPCFPFMVGMNEHGQWEPLSGQDRAPGGTPRLLEIPITTLRLRGKTLPIAGGGYFRLYPYAFTSWGLRRINREDRQPFVFYLHPWEFDPDQPRMVGAGLKSRMRHYLNLRQTEKRFRQLLSEFSFKPLHALDMDKDANVLLQEAEVPYQSHPLGVKV